MSRLFLNKKKIRNLEKNLKYQFTDYHFLEEALSHPSLKQSAKGKNVFCYERFELFGDAILNFVITEILFSKYPLFSESQLAKIKSYLISKDILYEIADLKLQLADYIIMSYSEENSNGRQNRNNVENTFEALIAAVYLDSNLKKTQFIIQHLWKDHLREFNPIDMDPKSTLQEWTQKLKLPMPEYHIVQQTGPSHLPKFTLKLKAGNFTTKATGKNIKEAEKKAAKNILKQIKDNKK